MYIFNSWKIFCNHGFHEVFLQNNNHQAVPSSSLPDDRCFAKNFMEPRVAE